MPARRQRIGRNLRLALLLAREFRWPGILLGLTVGIGGFVVHAGSGFAWGDSFFAAFSATFFEIIPNPPYPWYEQVFLYTAPFAGFFVIAGGVAIAVNMALGRARDMQRWWIMTAKTYRDHVVVGGIGKVGYRIIRELQRMGELVVAIDLKLDAELVRTLLDEKVPVIDGSVRARAALERANIRQAKAFICATDDDLANIDAGLTAREMKSDLRVVLRLFDDTLAPKISDQFGLPALSTSYVAAPTFVAEALDLDKGRGNLTIYGRQARVSSMRLGEEWEGRTVAELEHAAGVRVLGRRPKSGEDDTETFPAPDDVLAGGDELMIAALQGRSSTAGPSSAPGGA